MDFVLNDTIYDEIPRNGKSSPAGGFHPRLKVPAQRQITTRSQP
jgi:hypothetical protein